MLLSLFLRYLDFCYGVELRTEITCWNCTACFDVMEASFCNHPNPTKVCPFCLSCYCNASDEYKNKIIENSPKEMVEEKNNIYQKLGEILIRANRITEEQLAEAVSKQVFLKKKLGEILVMLGYISDDELSLYLLGQKWIDTIDLKHQTIDFNLIEKIGPEFCLKYKAIPLELFDIKNEWVFRVVLFDPNKLIEIKQIEELRNVRIIPYKANIEDIGKVLQKIKKFFDEDKILVLS